MKDNGKIVGIVRGVKFRDVKQTLALETIIEILGIERGVPADVEVSLHAIDAGSLDIDRVFGESGAKKGRDNQGQHGRP
jgi:hypothetical protein